MNKQIEALMRLADEYAHVYSFVGDDTMPKARKALNDAVEAFVNELTKPQETEIYGYDIFVEEKDDSYFVYDLNDHQCVVDCANHNAVVTPLFKAPPNYEALLQKYERLLKTLTIIRNSSPDMWKSNRSGGQDKYAGMPPCFRLIDEALAKDNHE